MDEIEETEKEKIKLSEIRSARIMIRVTRTGKKIVRVQISYTKKRCTNVELEFPNDIKEEELYWETYHGERIAVYHRTDANDYTGMEHILIPTQIGQKLESLVAKAFSKRANRNKGYTLISK